jgi:hypothetical protein
LPKFRKKPVVIEAWENIDPTDMTIAYPSWLIDAVANGGVLAESDGRVTIRTLEGFIVASPGDWIIRGVKGELYPCKPDIFAQTYEPAE